MADYLPVRVIQITERKTDDGEIRKSAVCQTVQPEQFNLNLSRLDAARLQKFNDNVGNIIMVPIRRGEINGRPFTSIADGHIFRDSDVVATFSLTDKPDSGLPLVNVVDLAPAADQPPAVEAIDEKQPEKPALAFGKK
ncbi:hypothetical protein NP590_11275 [Methylomonas sp. SURF-2]|uniref:Uncharacterized protein n=1 Tax=Methylomonas subterranea TaxID=2952225 RepID=A0ABT1THG3_9GAMM|nr:hypothetical protein [Methylomonas sp. SURF-2]MCQ8104688.1 hypothetical protein [Methylomonas sp. SURF-2]